MKSVLVNALYERELWPWENCAKHLPKKQERIGDATSALTYSLKEDLTPQRARAFLGCVATAGIVECVGGRWVDGRDELIKLALECLIETSDRDNSDYSILSDVMFAGAENVLLGLGRVDIEQVFSENEAARRESFHRGAEADPTGSGRGTWWWKHILREDDVDWLARFVDARNDPPRWLCEHLLHIAYLFDAPQTVKNRIRADVRTKHPEAVVEFDRRRKKGRQQHQRWERQVAEREERRRDETIPVEAAVNDVLSSERLDTCDKLRKLGSMHPANENLRPANLAGGWSDLSDETLEKVTAFLLRALDQCEPTAILDGDSCYASVWHEADAFTWAIQHVNGYTPTDHHVRKWFPAVLRVQSPANGEVLTACFQSDTPAAEDVILEELTRGSRSTDSWAYIGENLPAEFWSKRLIQGALKLVEDEKLNLSERGRLLRTIARETDKRVRAMAETWATAKDRNRERRSLKRSVGIDILVVMEPAYGLRLLRKNAESGDVDLEQMTSLTDGRSAFRPDFSRWSAENLAELVDLLWARYPQAGDPEEQAGVVHTVTPERQLRWTRDMLLTLIFKRKSKQNRAALARLAASHTEISTWYESALASDKSEFALQSFNDVPGALPLEAILRLFENPNYRLIRDEEDLQEAILKALKDIAKNARHHLAMLYRSQNPGGKTQRRQPQREDALQAYFHCRLQDRLPERVLDRGAVVVLNRETVEGENRRFDIKVQSATVPKGEVTVVIEVKWSKNQDVSTSLREQLGRNYLIEENLTHGIYLVGWCGPGKWRNFAPGEKPKDRRDLRSWQTAFESQAADFQSEHPGVNIKALVVDLSWSDAEATDRSPAGRASG